MPFFSRNPDSPSNSAPSDAGSQHILQPQQRFKRSVARLFRGSRHHDTTPQVPGVNIATLESQQRVDGHEQHASGDIASDNSRPPGAPHRNSFNPVSMQAECRNTFPNIAESVATQFQGAQGFNISGHPQFTNNVTTVYNYGGTHGLEKLEKFVSFAALHDSAEQDPTRRCHPGTRKNVLTQLREWFDNPNATDSICWLHGPAGAGKSAIAQTIAHEYKERGVVATFFFYRSDPERHNGNRLFPTLAWQLAFSIPAIKHFIIRALDQTPHLPRKDIETQFEELVASPFHPMNNVASQISQPFPVVIIDGVDECSDEQLQRRILAVIGNAVKDSRVPLHFLICSRPEALIEEALDQFKAFTLRIDLATLDDSNRDIEQYLVDQFSDIASKRGLAPTWPNPEIIEEFVFKSSGNFIFAATVMRYISDEDCDPEEQLDIVRNLKPRGKTSPFALLDELYLEILKQQRDQDFLKTFLALFVGRSSIKARDLHEDDATLMNVSEKNLHVKLRRMRSLLKFEPFIDVHHKSFLDFLQDLSRSGQYQVSEQGGQKRYLELIVDCVVRHISTAIEQPNGHEECRSRLKFRSIVKAYPPKIVLPAEDWQETLKPLLDLQNRLFNTSQPQPCHVTQVMRELLLHLMLLQKKSQAIAAAQTPESNMDETVTQWSPAPVTEAWTNLPENDVDRCLSDVLLSCLEKTNSALAVDAVVIERMSSLLAFDYAETAAKVRSVIDTQKLIDIIDLLNNDEAFLSKCGRNAARKAALLASEIYARVPLLPRSVFLNGPPQQCDWLFEATSGGLQLLCQSTLISRMLDHTYIIPAWCIYQGDKVRFVDGNVNERNEPVHQWLRRARPDFITRIQAMFEVAKTIRYIHSMDVIAALSSNAIRTESIALDSNLHARIQCSGIFAWQVRENLLFEDEYVMTEFTPEHNISTFAHLLDSVCFDDDDEDLPDHPVQDVTRLIERCRAEDPKSRPTMENVVKEMETWNLT